MPETLYNPFTGRDEILFKDEDGTLKVLRGERIVPWQPPVRPPPPPPLPDPLAVAAQALLAEVRKSISDERLIPRLQTILTSRLKEIRDVVECREVLLRPVAAGGMGLSPEAAEAMLRTIERHVEEYHSLKRQGHDLAVAAVAYATGAPNSGVASNFTPGAAAAVPVTPAAPAQATAAIRLTPLPPEVPLSTLPLPPVVTSAMATAATPPQRSPAPKVQVQPTAQAKPPVPASPGAALPLVPEALLEQAPGVTPTASPSESLPPLVDATPPMEPVRFRPKLTGPLEELREMTLMDFRRLDPNPRNATDRISEKIALQEQQSFAMKAKAIAAWRQCEIFRLYADLAGEAMSGKQAIAEVIGRWQAAGTASLTAAEFEAIADFNQTLRF